MDKYICYEVLECPNMPTENGRHIFSTPILEQARIGCESARKIGKSYFIKGIKSDGREVYLV